MDIWILYIYNESYTGLQNTAYLQAEINGGVHWPHEIIDGQDWPVYWKSTLVVGKILV